MRISRAQPIFSGKKRRHDAHSVETLYIFTPPNQSVAISVFPLGSGGTVSGRGETLYTQGRALLTSRPPTFPSTSWGCRPKTLRSAVRDAHCLTTEFSCGKLAQFWRSKVLSRLAWCALNFQKYFRHFPDAFSAFGRTPRASRGSFSCFGIAPEDFPAHFQPLGAFPRLPPRISMLRERSHDFPGAFPGFGSVPTASPAHFRASGAFPRFPLRVFSLRERSVAAQCAAYRVFLRKTRAVSAFGSAPSQRVALLCLSGVCPNAHTGIVRAWRGNHTKSFHQEDEPWQRRQLQR